MKNLFRRSDVVGNISPPSSRGEYKGLHRLTSLHVVQHGVAVALG